MRGWLVIAIDSSKYIQSDESKQFWQEHGFDGSDEEEVFVLGCDKCRRFMRQGPMVTAEEWARVPEKWQKAMLCTDCMREFIGDFVGF